MSQFQFRISISEMTNSYEFTFSLHFLPTNYLNENYFLNHFVIFLHNDSKRLLIILEQLHLEAYIVNYIL